MTWPRRSVHGPSSSRAAWSRAVRALRDVLVIGVVSFLLGELVLRVWDRISPSFVFYDDSYNRFRSMPHVQVHSFTTNSLGFLDTEPAAEKGNRLRILALGDSFAWGAVPYDHNYLTLLENLLQADDPGFEVVNMGIPSIGPPDYLALLINEGLALDPDFVLVSFFIGNDFTERHRRSGLHDLSHVVALLRYVVALRPRYQGLPSADSVYDDESPTFAEDVYLDIEKRRAKISTGPLESFARLLDESVAPLVQISQTCRRRGIGLVVVMIPDEFQVSHELQARIGESLGRPPTDIDWFRPNRMFGERLDTLGIAAVDLVPHFAQRGAGERLYRVRDTHWNIAGNRLASELIARYLEAEGPLLTRRRGVTD